MKDFLLANWQWILTTTITILGLYLTYKGVKNNFKHEVIKLKQEVALDKMQQIPYDICELMDSILDKKNNESKNISLMKKMMANILSYGTSDAVRVAIYMQRHSYGQAKQSNHNSSYKGLCLYSLLITQIKYDLTSQVVPADSYLRLRLTDYEIAEEEIRSITNSLIKELSLNKAFRI